MIEMKVKENMAPALRQMDELQKRVQSLSKGAPAFYQRAGIRMHRDVIRHFSEEKAEDGSSWPAWSPDYARRRAAGRGGNRMLQDTGILRASVLWEALPANARVYTDAPYAASHQFGDEARGIPKREYMWLSGEERRAIAADLLAWTRSGHF